jgi:fused signal recognition particle receptor
MSPAAKATSWSDPGHELARPASRRLSKTADKLADNLTGLTSRAALDTATLDDIEEALIASDIGPEASSRIRQAIAAQKFERLDERGLRTILAEEIEKILAPVAKPLEVWGFPRPHVILVIGVNGSGKTTTIGKLGHWLKELDYGVLLCAGDTFRAAAIEQLKIWGERIGAPVISGKEGADPAGLVFDGVKQATAQGIDVLVVDTAGRMQNKRHLMDELSKIRRVLGRLNTEAPHDVILVLDATTGQNALAQVEVFRDVANVTGLIMTKLDGTAGAECWLRRPSGSAYPIYAIGVGETAEDLRPFDPRSVARAIAGLPPNEHQKEPSGGIAAADRRRPADRLLRRQFLRPGAAGAEDLRRDRSLHGRDGRGDDLLGAPLRANLADALVLRRARGSDGRGHLVAPRRDFHQDEAHFLLSARRGDPRLRPVHRKAAPQARAGKRLSRARRGRAGAS